MNLIYELTIYMALLLMTAGLVGPAANVLANSVNLKTNLVAGPGFHGVKGTAKFRNRSGEKEFQEEAKSHVLANSTLTVWVNDIEVGTIPLNASGEGRLNLNSCAGQTIPQITPGTLLESLTRIVLAGKI